MSAFFPYFSEIHSFFTKKSREIANIFFKTY